MRIDSTVTEAMTHEPTDSSLLWDGVRIMNRLLKQTQSLNGAPSIAFRNHRRVANRPLRHFRAGIEAGISCLKRAYGLARCTWKGLEHFKRYVWSSVVAHNLATFARRVAT